MHCTLHPVHRSSFTALAALGQAVAPSPHRPSARCPARGFWGLGFRVEGLGLRVASKRTARYGGFPIRGATSIGPYCMGVLLFGGLFFRVPCFDEFILGRPWVRHPSPLGDGGFGLPPAMHTEPGIESRLCERGLTLNPKPQTLNPCVTAASSPTNQLSSGRKSDLAGELEAKSMDSLRPQLQGCMGFRNGDVELLALIVLNPKP